MLYSSVLGNISLGSFTLGETEIGIPVFEDNLNNWGELVAITGQFTNPSLTDDLNNWNVGGDGFTSVLGEINLGLFTLGEVGGAEEVQVALGDSPNQFITASDTNEANWNDSILLHIGLLVTDTNSANWNDVFAIDYLIFTFNQTINVSSSLATRPGPGGSPPRDAWKDGVNYTLAPFADLDISAEDLETFLSAYLQLGIGLILSDDANNLADANVTSGTAGVFAFDSMFFNIFDEAKAASGSSSSISDSLNNLSDAVGVSLIGGVELSDNFNFNDNVSISFTTLPTPGDTLTLNDLLGLVIGVGLSFSDDTNNLADLFLNSPASTTLNVDEDDTLSMVDGLSSGDILLGTSLTSYIRRYLNDIIN